MRPKIYLKLATSLDGKIALKNGQSKWITNKKSRADVQTLRANSDGIICGIGTVLKDNPNLNLRGVDCLPEKMPARIIFDSKLQTPNDYNIVNQAIGGKTIIFFDKDIAQNGENRFGDNVQLYGIGSDEYGLSIPQALEILGNLGLRKLMLETGGRLAASFLKQGLVDYIYWFFAPKIIGGDGVDVFANLGFESLEQVIKLTQIKQIELDGDLLRVFEVKK